MSVTVCLRFYRVFVCRKSDTYKQRIKYSEIDGMKGFVTRFVSTMPSENSNTTLERSWSFEERTEETNRADRCSGYIHYGTYGFASRFKSRKTKSITFNRGINDVEEVPLFYDFWSPDDENVFLVFQTFQGRSCSSLVRNALVDWFADTYRGYRLVIEQVVPQTMRGSTFAKSPVKNIKLIKRRTHSDIADVYVDDGSEEVNIELSIKSKRRKNLGSLSSVIDKFKNPETRLISFGDITFDEAAAEVQIGGKIRKVGVFGGDKDAGLVDISTNVQYGSDGHPEFSSISNESAQIVEFVISEFGIKQ